MKRTIRMIFAGVLAAIALAASVNSLRAQSIGINFVGDGNANGIGGSANIETNDTSLLPSDTAGVYPQTNWNNLGRYGSANPGTLTNSVGNPVSLGINWDSGFADVTGSASLGTGDGKLMGGFIYSWGPGTATTLQNSIYGNPINNKPLAFISGLNAWYTSLPGAEGYKVVIYASGYSYFETGEYWVQSATGSPFDNTMGGGPDLGSHYFIGDTGAFSGSYVGATGTSSGSATFGANYVEVSGLTNDAILVRNDMPVGGYGSGMNGIQFVPVYPAAPTATTPAIAPASTVYAGVPVTFTEVASGDPFQPTLWYQWLSDNATGGAVTNLIGDATNSTLTVTPTNSTNSYNIQYAVIVSNIFGAATSSVATLTVLPAVPPQLLTDTTPGAGNGAAAVYAYVNGNISFNAVFGGTQPINYQWQVNTGAGYTNVPSATNTTLTLSGLQTGSAGSYELAASNSVGSSNSTPAVLTVLADPAAPTAGQPYAYDVFTNNPFAYWRLSETIDPTANNSVQAYDYTGNNNNGTYGNQAADNLTGPTPPTFAGFESGNTCAGFLNAITNSLISIPSLNLNTNTVTITEWINPNVVIGTYWGLFMWRSPNGDAAGLGFGGATNGGGVAGLGYTWNSNSSATYGFNSGLYPTPGQWSFVAAVVSPTNTTLYLYTVNGGGPSLSKASLAITNLPEAFSGGTIYIGSDNGAGRNFNGLIDEVAVFNKSLSEAQVQDLFFKGVGIAGAAPVISSTTVYPTTSLYSGQDVTLSASAYGSVPITYQWQSSPDNSTWTNIPGAISTSVDVNPLVVGTVYYRLLAANSIGTNANSGTAVTFNALPSSPAGLWTVNYQVTNHVLGYTTGGGVGYYSGRGILGTRGYWNVMPDTGGAFDYLAVNTSVSDLNDDGATHSGVYASLFNCSAFASAAVVQPDSSDIGNLLYQWDTVVGTPTNALQLHGVPDGIYNVCCYGCDGAFNDRGTTFVVHGQNGDQAAGTINAAPIVPLQQGVNFVLFSNVHVTGGTLLVDVGPTSPVPAHDPNTEADFNGVQVQLVSYDPAPSVYLASVLGTNSTSLSWPQGLLQTATNLNGPWTYIYAPSPVTLPINKTNAQQYFRVKVR